MNVGRTGQGSIFTGGTDGVGVGVFAPSPFSTTDLTEQKDIASSSDDVSLEICIFTDS